jgi:pimeloyl-ACP methyl ester carboxylesterase
MSKVTVGPENSADIEIYYKDHGAGQPVVLIHGYPLPDDHLRPARVRAIQPPPRSPPRSPTSAPGPTDFRDDLPKIDVPMLILHGDADQVLPLDKTSKRLPGLIKDVQLTIVEGGPHAITWTHADQVNTALCDFLRR